MRGPKLITVEILIDTTGYNDPDSDTLHLEIAEDLLRGMPAECDGVKITGHRPLDEKALAWWRQQASLWPVI